MREEGEEEGEGFQEKDPGCWGAGMVKVVRARASALRKTRRSTPSSTTGTAVYVAVVAGVVAVQGVVSRTRFIIIGNVLLLVVVLGISDVAISLCL